MGQSGFAQAPWVRQGPAESGPGAAASRWMYVWITIGLLVVLVVIGFLLGIVGALESIDSALEVADSAVTGAGGDVKPLPAHISDINGNLAPIDRALKPVPGQADEIIAALTSIKGSLVKVDSSLKDTSGSLVNTSGSLVTTSGVLKTVLGLANDIERTLEDAQSPPDNLGTSDIWQRVAVANGILRPAKEDADNILSGLVQVNRHLVSICRKLPTGSQC